MNRRGFFLSALSATRVIGANDRVRIGLIGCGGRGRYVAGFMAAAPGAELVAAADVHLPAAEATGVAAFQDFRRLLERSDVDAVLIATPDHWHAGAMVLACAAGKHVYVEKPLAHNVKEGRAMVEAARRANRIVQVGTQHRSAPHLAEVAEIIRGGILGEVRFVRVWNFLNRTLKPLGRPADGEPPPGLNWDMYLGPAPVAPYNPARWKGTFRQFTDYAGGTITDFGTHRFDTVHQIMGVDRPKSVSASGGRFTLKDAGDVPDMLQVTYEYPGFVLSYEACDLNAHGLGGRRPGMRYYGARGGEDRPNGMAFYGTNGAIFADRIGYEIYPDNDRIATRQINSGDATKVHAQYFVECIRSGTPSRADLETGHRSTTVPHLGNIAYRTGLKLRWDAEREDFVGAPEASRLLWREPRRPWDFVKKPA